MDTTKNDEKKDVQSGLAHLERIEADLEDIKDRTANPRRSFFNGIFQGAGALLGGVFALVVLGWLLSILGVLPGFASLAAYLHGVVDRFNTRY